MSRQTWFVPASRRTGLGSCPYPNCATDSPQPLSFLRWRDTSVACSGLPPPTGHSQPRPATIRGARSFLLLSEKQSNERFGMRAQLERDFERFKRELPRDFPSHVRDTYRIDLGGRYLGYSIPHPIGKGSGQLSLSA